MPAIIGTLVHYGIAKVWRPGHQASRAALESQVILAAYHAMRGNDLPIHVTEEHCELPFIHTTADDRIWSGVIDHLYRLENGEWVLDDYKTDAKIGPQRYEIQMRLYGDAARAWTKQPPKLRLVYLRHAKVVQLDS